MLLRVFLIVAPGLMFLLPYISKSSWEIVRSLMSISAIIIDWYPLYLAILLNLLIAPFPFKTLIHFIYIIIYVKCKRIKVCMSYCFAHLLTERMTVRIH